ERVLVTSKKSASVVRVAQQRIQSRPCRRVGKDIRIIGKYPIGDAAWGHWAFRIHRGLIVLLVDIPPPGLGVADKLGLRKLLHHFVEPLDAHVESAMLEM